MVEDWQPIETAPMDGTRIMVGYRNGWVGFGWWEAQENRWVLDRSGIAAAPTHWKPQPEPPK